MQILRKLVVGNIVAFLLAVAPALAHKPLVAPPNYLKDDSALAAHVASDRRLSSVQNCRTPSLRRATEHGTATFTYSAVCDMRPPSNGLCRRYRVIATGTVDTAQTYSAFVREVTLTTLCESGANNSFKPKPLRGSA